jgi:hypothetical protein
MQQRFDQTARRGMALVHVISQLRDSDVGNGTYAIRSTDTRWTQVVYERGGQSAAPVARVDLEAGDVDPRPSAKRRHPGALRQLYIAIADA